MKRLDRILSLLVLLQGGRPVSASALARRFEVSVRTVYRDLEVLSGLGAAIIPELGRRGGFRLGPGYFLPPVTLDTEEAVSLLLGLALSRALRVLPFPSKTEMAEKKLLAVLPEETRRTLERASRFIGFERVPPDLLHPERGDPPSGSLPEGDEESRVVGRFLRAILTRSRLRISYRSPYRGETEALREIEPRGIVWDRDRWYLVGDVEVRAGEPRMWRADRVVDMRSGPGMKPTPEGFDVSSLLGRRWLGKAMERWRAEHPVRIALPGAQADTLRRDWYFGHALYEDGTDGRTVMTLGEGDYERVSALLRWLGPGAELLGPAEWRDRLAGEFRGMAAMHGRPG
jgi:predicted DNA-binding transcriptional regulator YafY